MRFDDEKILQDYLGRLLQMQDERDDWLDEDDLHAAARDLGLSDDDLARVAARVAAHRQRGQRFAEHQAWDDALAELRQAAALAPFDAGLLHETAEVYAHRYRQTANPADREAAERYAHRTIQLDADHTASYELLTALRTMPEVAEPSRRPLVPMLVGGLIVGLVVALVAVFFFAVSSDPPTPPVVAERPGAATEAPGAASLSAQQVLPVTLAPDEAAGLTLDVQRSLFRNFDSTFSYTLHAGLRVAQAELHQLRLRLDLLDAAGTVVRSEEFDALGDTEPYLRPGDTVPVDHLLFERRPPPALDAARLSVAVVERQEAAADYGAATPIDHTWEATKPAYFNLEITERENRMSQPLGNRRLHFLSVAVRNTGTRAFHRLQIKAVWYDAAGQQVASNERYVVTSSMPALQPGETYVTRFIGEFPPGEGSPFERYTLEVTSAD